MFGIKASKFAQRLGLVLVLLGLTTAPVVAKEWNQYLNGPQHRSFINITGPQSEPAQLWQNAVAGRPGNPVLADDGTVYISSAKTDYGVGASAPKYTSNVYLYAFDKTGALKFQKTLLSAPYNGDVYSDVAAFRLAVGATGEIFAAGSDYNNKKSYVYALDSAGNIKWEKLYDNILLSGESVVSSNNTIYVTEGTNFIHALNGGNGTVLWKADIGGGNLGGCTLSNDELVIYAGNEWGTVSAVNSADGTIKWSISNMHTSRTPVVANDGNLLIANTYYQGLYILNQATGDLIWPATMQRGQDLGGEPGVTKDNKAIALEWLDNKVSSYSVPGGQKNWETANLGTPYRSPIVDAQGNIYFGTQSDMFYALNAGGQKIWEKSIKATDGTYRSILSNMIMDQSGRVYFVGSTNYQEQSYLMCYGSSGTVSPAGVSAPTFNPAAGTYSSAQQITISSATAGATIRYTTDGTEPTASSVLYTSPVTVSKRLTLKAKASKSSMTDSATTQATYSITTSTEPGSYILNNHWTDGSAFDFAAGKSFSLWNNTGNSDGLEIVGALAELKLRGNLIDMGSSSLEQLTTPPSSGYGTDISPAIGHAYWAKVTETAGDSYYKFLITAIDPTLDASGNATSVTFKYQKYSAAATGDYLTWAGKTVAKGHVFTISFSREIDPATLANTIYVQTYAGLRINAAVSQDATNKAKVTVSPPSGGYSPGGVYFLMIEKGVATPAKTALKQAVKMQFSIAP